MKLTNLLGGIFLAITLSGCGVTSSSSTLATTDTSANAPSEPARDFIYGNQALALTYDSSDLHLFVSYPGRLGNICGLRVLALGGSSDGVSEKITVRAEDIRTDLEWVTLTADQFMSYDFTSLVLDQSFYGINIHLKTNDGTAIKDLADGQLVLVPTTCSLETQTDEAN